MDEENRILNGESLDDMEIVRWDGPGGRRWPSALGMPPAPHPEEEEPLPAEPVAEGSDPADVTEAPPEELPAGVPAAEEPAEAAEEAPPAEAQPEGPVPAENGLSETEAAAEEPEAAAPEKPKKAPARKKKASSAAKKKPRAKPELTFEERWEQERRYMPIRTRRDGNLGCLSGLMYAVFILCASVALAVFAWMAASDVLALNKDPGSVEITIPETAFVNKEIDVKDEDGNVTGTRTVRAADIHQVAGTLKDYGLINYKWLFEFYSKFAHADLQIDPGTYTLATNLDYRALVKKMQSGADSQLQILVMFPEGFNMEQIFTRLEENGVCSKEDLYKAAADTEFSYAFLEDAETGDAGRLEGYLFPDSYYFYQGMQASSAINKFLANMHYQITDEMWQQTKSLGLTFRQVLTVASIIEKEAGADDERDLIAAVIYNRLAVGMPLQMDSTVHYVLGSNDIALSVDLIQNTESPYNTYLYNGLPPGPICSPGLRSIQAALSPAQVNYLYFALDKETGTHRFFYTYEEHEAFVATQDYMG